jgi:monoamine oxidase
MLAQGLDSSTTMVLLNHPVSRISWADPASVVVTMENGQNFRSDHVVVTIPLGALKENIARQGSDAFFNPVLPAPVLEAARHMAVPTLHTRIQHTRTQALTAHTHT